MSPWQAAQQLKFRLLTRTWPDSPNRPVFPTVHVTQGPIEAKADTFRMPCVVLRTMASEADPEQPTLKWQTFEAVIAAVQTGDTLGEFAIVGGQRTSQGGSRGRGILELEEQLLQVTSEMNHMDGVHVQEMAAGAVEADMVDGVGYVAVRPITLRVLTTLDRVYTVPNVGKRLTATVGAFVTLTWHWAERFDLHAAYAAQVQISAARGSLILRRLAGAVAPATVTDGVGITILNNAQSVVDAPGAGTFSYSLFARYDEFNDGATSLRTTAPASVTSVVVP